VLETLPTCGGEKARVEQTQSTSARKRRIGTGEEFAKKAGEAIKRKGLAPNNYFMF
jgi:hypothetical protein